ncbi:MAG TPA: hypothetical protein VFX29_06240 [Longimicrobiaceae bacterium]|nr:hypothetical protein [Longimicrobiaceae bacterium]
MDESALGRRYAVRSIHRAPPTRQDSRRELPLPGITIEFLSTVEQVTEYGYPYAVAHLTLSRLGGTASGSALTERTDDLGRAAVRVRFGERAAAAGVILNVATLG